MPGRASEAVGHPSERAGRDLACRHYRRHHHHLQDVEVQEVPGEEQAEGALPLVEYLEAQVKVKWPMQPLLWLRHLACNGRWCQDSGSEPVLCRAQRLPLGHRRRPLVEERREAELVDRSQLFSPLLADLPLFLRRRVHHRQESHHRA